MKGSTTVVSLSLLAVTLLFPFSGTSYAIAIPASIDKRSPQYSSGSSSGGGSSGGGSSGTSSGSDGSAYSGSDDSYDGGDYAQYENDDYNVDSYDTPCQAGVPQGANTATVNLMEGYETFQPNPYDDGYGNPTVGYGHLCSNAACSGTGFTYPMTQATATQLFQQDIGVAESCVTSHVQVPLNANQYGALVSWAFNEGCPHIAGSTLFSELNAGQDPNTVASQQLPQWRMASGRVSQGLVNRRAAEVNLFQTANSDSGTCP